MRSTNINNTDFIDFFERFRNYTEIEYCGVEEIKDSVYKYYTIGNVGVCNVLYSMCDIIWESLLIGRIR